MVCTMVLSLTLVFKDGHKENFQRHFNQASLEKFEKSLNTVWDASDIGLPRGSQSVENLDIVDYPPFKCGTKPGPK